MHALTEVMLKGTGFAEIGRDILVLSVLSAGVILLNVQLLKKQRKI